MEDARILKGVIEKAVRIVITHESGHEIMLTGELRQMILDGLDALAAKKSN